jgi:hypothetical protein
MPRPAPRLLPLFSLLIPIFAGCGDKDGGDSAAAASGGACGSLCAGGGFSGGEEVDYGGGVIECTCAGSGSGLSAEACADYCEPFGVSAEHALLSSEASSNDKCVCDGTQG